MTGLEIALTAALATTMTVCLWLAIRISQSPRPVRQMGDAVEIMGRFFILVSMSSDREPGGTKYVAMFQDEQSVDREQHPH